MESYGEKLNVNMKEKAEENVEGTSYHYNPVTEPFSTSIIWSLWSLLMCGTSRSDQTCVTEPPWLLLNPPGLD